MSTWADEDLERIGAADEIDVTTAKPDGSQRQWVTIWVVRVGTELFVRSVRAEKGRWYQHAAAQGAGRIRLDGREYDVDYLRTSGEERAAVDEAFRTKYATYDDSIVEPMAADPAAGTTLQLVPRP